jgi:ABC-type amino acid transport substrate-binding protein
MPVARLFQNQPALRVFTIALIVLTSLIATSTLANETTRHSQETISIGVVADNEPYSNYGASGVEGFSIDVLNEISRISGLKLEYRVGSWSDIFAAFQRGELDAIDEISWREDRAQSMLFTRPYHIRQTIVMHNKLRPLPAIGSLEDERYLLLIRFARRRAGNHRIQLAI